MTIQTDGTQFIFELGHLYREAMRTIEQQIGMSQSRLEIMHELMHTEEMSQADLQQHLGVEGPVITRIVKQLEASGLVTRRPDPNDNRFTLVALSAEARSMHTATHTLEFKETFGTQYIAGLNATTVTHLLGVMSHIEENITVLREENLTGAQHADPNAVDVPLSTPQNQGWQFHIALIHLYRDMVQIIEEQAGMSYARLEILYELFQADEISQAELEQRLGMEGAVITRIVKQLETGGFITRRRDPQDNRFTLVMLSAEGRRLSEEKNTITFKETLGVRLMAGLDEAARSLLLTAMNRIRENVIAIQAAGNTTS